MLYRLYTPDDFPQLYLIEEQCFQPPLRFSRRYMRNLVSLSHREVPGGATWVAEEDDRLAGFAIVEWAEDYGVMSAYVETIEVAAEHRGKGAGGELLSRIEASAKAAGAGLIRLHVSENNPAAIRLYEASGYRREGREEDFYGKGHAGLAYAKTLAV